MHVNGLGSASANINDIQKKLNVNQQEKPENRSEVAIPSGDTVSISDEGMQKAQELKEKTVKTGASSQGDTSGAEPDSNAEPIDASTDGKTSVNVDELKQSLQKKKSEVSSKQAKLEAAKRVAEDDPSQQSEIKKLQNQVSRLEKEAQKIKTQIYSAG